jgi:hypothetical protein
MHGPPNSQRPKESSFQQFSASKRIKPSCTWNKRCCFYARIMRDNYPVCYFPLLVSLSPSLHPWNNPHSMMVPKSLWFPSHTPLDLMTAVAKVTEPRVTLALFPYHPPFALLLYFRSPFFMLILCGTWLAAPAHIEHSSAAQTVAPMAPAKCRGLAAVQRGGSTVRQTLATL